MNDSMLFLILMFVFEALSIVVGLVTIFAEDIRFKLNFLLIFFALFLTSIYFHILYYISARLGW